MSRTGHVCAPDCSCAVAIARARGRDSIPRTFTLDSATDQSLESWAERTGMNKSATVRAALRRLFDGMNGAAHEPQKEG